MSQTATGQSTRWPALFSVPSALIGFAVLYAVTLTYPLNIDASVHAYMAQLLLKGQWPYVSVWENNFPGTVFFVHVPELLLLGRSAFAFHLWDMMWQLAGAYLLYKLVARHSNPRAAWLAVMLTAAYYVSLDNLYIGQRDGFATVALLGALWILQSHQGKARVVLAGIVTGIAILIRPTNEIYVLAFCALFFVRRPFRVALREAASFGLAAQAWLLVFLLFYLANGWIQDFYTIAIRFNTEVYAHALPLAGLIYPLPHYALLLVGSTIGMIVWKSSERITVIALLIASLVSLVPQKRYPYQYHTTFVLLLWLSAVGWDGVITLIHDRLKLQVGWVSAACYLLIPLFALVWYTRGTTQKRVATAMLSSHLPTTPVRWMYDDSPRSGYSVLDSVAHYLQAHVSRDGRVQMIGEYTYPLFEADVLPATRFITFHSVMLRGRSGELSSFQQSWRQEILDSVLSGSTSYVIVADAPDYARGHLNGLLGHEILTQDFTALHDLLQQHYTRETAIGAFTMYRRIQ